MQQLQFSFAPIVAHNLITTVRCNFIGGWYTVCIDQHAITLHPVTAKPAVRWSIHALGLCITSIMAPQTDLRGI